MEKEIMLQLRRLLGFNTIAELADFLGMTKDTANSLNIGRGSKNLIKAYQTINRLLKTQPAEDRRDFFQPSLPVKLTLSEKYHKIERAKTKLASLPADILVLCDKVYELSEAQKEYMRLNDSL